MKWFRKHKILTGLLIVLLILVLLVLCAVWFYLSKLDLIEFDDEIDDSVYQSTVAVDATEATEGDILSAGDIAGLEQVETAPTVPQGEIEKADNVMNILLIGTDERTRKFNSFARSDCMIIVSIDKNAKTVKLVSLERGMGVPVKKGQYKGQYDWLTHIFQYGGAKLLVETVEECFLVDIDNYVRVNFTSVKSIVDTVGGVEVEMTWEEANYLTAASQGRVQLRKGVNKLDGKTALAYARLREIDSDWSRVKRQRKVILGTVNAVKGSNLFQLNDLANEVLPMIQTDLSVAQISELLLYAPNFLQSEFDQMTIPVKGTYGGMTGVKGRNLFAVDFEKNAKILHDFLYGEG